MNPHIIEDQELTCPHCHFQGTLADFDNGGLPDGIVICNHCLVTIDVETGQRYDGPLDDQPPALVKRPTGQHLPAVAGEFAGFQTGDSTPAAKETEEAQLTGEGLISCDAGRVEAAGVAHEPVSWPTPAAQFWWMRCRLRPRGKWRILLVELLERQGTEYVKPHEDNNCYPRSITDDWQAQFLPAQTPPTFE